MNVKLSEFKTAEDGESSVPQSYLTSFRKSHQNGEIIESPQMFEVVEYQDN